MELADDLESFLYLLLWMAARFHVHGLSIEETRQPGVNLEDLRRYNQMNEALAQEVSRFFFEEVKLEDDLVGGGSAKRSAIDAGQSPIKLSPSSDGTASPLAVLIEEVYAIVQEHHQAIDVSSLEPYSVHRARAGPSQSPPQSMKAVSEESEDEESDDSEDEESAPKKGAGRGRKAGAGAGGGRGKKSRDSDDF